MLVNFCLLCTLLSDITNAALLSRGLPTCTDIKAKSNNGGRKIAVVIDSSGSMEQTDPYDYRLTAGRQVIDWLVSKGEASGSRKQDLVTVVEFSSRASLDYPLGDPNSTAQKAVSRIGAAGGTYIAAGVDLAISELTKSGSGDTSDRSGILVFTDGEDTNTKNLVEKINQAAGMGIRVAFGFLTSDSTASAQNENVLKSIMLSRGRYFSLPNYNASNEFINGILVNGLTNNDNPDGDTTLFAGLPTSHFISGSETQTMTYNARKKEILSFQAVSVTRGTGQLTVQVVFDGKELAKNKLGDLNNNNLTVTSPGDGRIEVKVTASNATDDSIFIIGVTSNLPPKNCTVTFDGDPNSKKNLTKIAAIVAIFPLLGLALVSYLLYKSFWSKGHPEHHLHDHEQGGNPTGDKAPPQTQTSEIPPPTKPYPWFHWPPHHPPTTEAKKAPQENNAQDRPLHDMDDDDDDVGSDYTAIEEPEDPTDSDYPPHDPQDPSNSQNPNDPRRRRRMHIVRLRTYGNNHHHHIQHEHPCATEKCPMSSESHTCEADAPRGICTCVDPKCKLNSRIHRCEDKNFRHGCMGPDFNPSCPLSDPEYAKQKKEERDALVTKYVAQDLAMTGVRITATHLLRAGLGA